MENLSTETDISVIFRLWEEGNNDPHYDPVPLLTRLAELFEQETENYMKMDPDPFDERHPSRADPECSLGHMLKVIFRKDTFMNKLVNDYLRDNYYSRLGISGRNIRDLNIAACRLMLDITPGLETSAVFETPSNDALVHRLFGWAKESAEPLQTYATGLLAAAMEVQDIAVVFREKNAQMVPLMLKRLHHLQAQAAEERQAAINSSRPFAHLGSKCDPKSDLISPPPTKKKKIDSSTPGQTKENGLMSPPHWNSGPSTQQLNGEKPERRLSKDGESHSHKKEQVDGLKNSGKGALAIPDEDLPDGVGLLPPSTPGKEPPWSRTTIMSPPHNIPQHSVLRSPFHTSSNLSECSNSSWAEMENFVIGTVQMYPLTIATQQMFILRYLTPMGEYQEFLSHVFEHNALELIMKYTNLRESKDARLAFEALKYLASLLCHKKFSIEFINVHGLQRLLEVPRPSISATGVSICLYYLAYCEDAIERVCLLPQHTISDLVTYALWLLECSHDSGRCHATMFFGLSFQFRVILEEFDSQDGLRKLYNVVSTLPIMSTEEETALNEDEECSARQIVRHVCVALKRYYEAHLYIRAEQLRRAHMRESDDHRQLHHMPSYKATKSTPEEVQEQVETLLQLMSFRANWRPVDELLRLGGVTLLLQVIAFAYEWNYSGRAETVRSALDVLAICSVMPQVQLLFCEQVSMPDEGLTVGTNIILGAAEGEIVADPDVQRSALSVLINCVCAPIHRVGGTIARYSGTGYARKKANFRLSEDVILKMWDSVRSNNGIMVLLTLMTVKTPITDADSIRALACRALAGLARSETVKQIIGKLPLFTSGQLQNLMQNPILQDKRQEHVSFQKYALELLERVSGKAKPSGNEFEISLANIHRANVIAQTRINFNDKQLFQLIYQHLQSKGMHESAATVLKEAGLPLPKQGQPPALPAPFCYQRNATPAAIRPRISGSPMINHHLHRLPLSSPQLSALASPSSSPLGAGFTIRGSVSSMSGSSAGNMFSSNSLNSAGAQSQSTNSEAAVTTTPIKFNLSNHRKESLFINSPASKSLQKQISYEPAAGTGSPLQKTAAAATATCLMPSQENQVTLDSIITEYLTNQHALCKNPMVTCPQFNLFEPHKCPDPKAKRSAPINFTLRNMRRAVFPPHGGPDGLRLDRRLVHSRFCPVRTFRPAEDDGFFTCCEFLPNGQQLVVGTFQGEVKLFNLQSAVQEEISFQCHDSYIYHLQSHKSGKLLLSSCTWRQPLSALWAINNTNFDAKYTLSEEEYVEFSNQEQDKLIATNGQIATIYDVETGKSLMTLKPQVSNQYPKNRATFSPTNELVLSDGVLWDVNSGKEIHKLDKLNQNISGVFHPNGLEIVANTEVWDLRTFHLLRTVPTLDQCELIFSPDGAAIYTVSIEQDNDDTKDAFDSSFRTLDAHDYSPIATIDVKKNIHYIACNKYDTQISIVENVGMFDNMQESSVRVYDVGRRRDDDDEAEEEEDEDDDELDSGDDGSSDDNLNANGLMNLIDDIDVDENNDNDQDNDGDDADAGDDDDDQGEADDDSSDDSNDIEEVSIASSDSDFLDFL